MIRVTSVWFNSLIDVHLTPVSWPQYETGAFTNPPRKPSHIRTVQPFPYHFHYKSANREKYSYDLRNRTKAAKLRPHKLRAKNVKR